MLVLQLFMHLYSLVLTTATLSFKASPIASLIVCNIYTTVPPASFITTKVTVHWIPVKDCIIFRICLLTFKAPHGAAPAYISNLLTGAGYSPTRPGLRSAGTNRLCVPPTNSSALRSTADLCPETLEQSPYLLTLAHQHK